jgi:phosphatidylglycerol:prolipoprotein diacylglycerol transferase
VGPVGVHALFDVFAWIAAAGMAAFVARWRPLNFPVSRGVRQSYFAALVGGSALGAYASGTLNLWASGLPGIARSIEGAIFGGICAVEIWKRIEGVSARTGARYAAPLAIGVAVGRIGCYLSGIDDFTYGTPTGLPWAHDFGDGVMRHPVQIYESLAMAGFLIVYLAKLARRDAYWATNGFYLAVGFYGAQRFAWEFIKPYGVVAGPFGVFHFASAGLVIYAIAMLCSGARAFGGTEVTA